MSADPEARYWPHVRRYDGGCWVWTGAVSSAGYGQVRLGGVARRAHRVAWELARGAVPAGLSVLHDCDRPYCVNPEHLWLGTHTDNMRDCAAKGRASGRTWFVRRCSRETAARIHARAAAGERLAVVAYEERVHFDTAQAMAQRDWLATWERWEAEGPPAVVTRDVAPVADPGTVARAIALLDALDLNDAERAQVRRALDRPAFERRRAAAYICAARELGVGDPAR